MATTTAGLAEIVKQVFRQEFFEAFPPMDFSPEAQARRHWEDAVHWLEQREAVRAEWPWPKRSD